MNWLWSIIKPVVEPVLTPIMIAAAVGLTLAGAHFYDVWIDDPAVARAAREQYVSLAEVSSLQAQLERERLLRRAAENAVANHAQALFKAEERYAAEAERYAKEKLEYEAQLHSTGRACFLDDADIEWLRK